MKTTRLLIAAAPTTGVPVYSTAVGQYGDTLYTNRIRDKTGAVQVKSANGTDTFAFNLLGKMQPGDAWFSILSLTQADLDANFGVIKVVTLYPYMACKVASTVTPTLSAWLTE